MNIIKNLKRFVVIAILAFILMQLLIPVNAYARSNTLSNIDLSDDDYVEFIDTVSKDLEVIDNNLGEFLRNLKDGVYEDFEYIKYINIGISIIKRLYLAQIIWALILSVIYILKLETLSKDIESKKNSLRRLVSAFYWVAFNGIFLRWLLLGFITSIFVR